MSFLFKSKIKSRRGAKKQRNQTSEEILKRLEDYLKENSGEPAEFLVRFWKDQEHVFTYKEIREAILSEIVTEEMLELWRQDYSVLVSQKMSSLWQQAIKTGSTGQPLLNHLSSGFSFDVNKPSVQFWIKNRGADFVTAVTAEQKEAMKALLTRHLNGGYTVDELSRVIRPCIGLTKQQAEANLRYYNTIKETLQKDHPRMKKESAEKKAREAALKYAEKQHRQRAYTIAQTEMAFAYNKGMDEGIRQGQQQGLLGVMEKRWITSGDANVCARCAALNGIQIAMDTEFDFKGRVLFTGQKLTPPAHPRCACAVQYIEIESSVFEVENPEKLHLTFEDNKLDLVESQIQDEYHLIPEEHRSIIESAIRDVRIYEGNSKYDRGNGILYLGNGLENGEVIHEMAHALETSLMLYENPDFIEVLQSGFEDFEWKDIVYVPDEYGKPVCFIRNPKLISEYQGRLYEEVGFWGDDDKLNPYSLGDYFAEGYKEFILNPENLKTCDRKLYDFIKGLVE